MTETAYMRPKTVDEAVGALLSAPGDSMLVAGGLVVGSIINQKIGLPGLIVDISRIESMQEIKRTADGGIAIGALVTHEAVLRSPLVRESFPLLTEIAADIACGRLRNRGTLGGSLCMIGQQGDPATGLVVLEATIRLRGPDGSRSLSLEEFYKDAFAVDLAEGEILEEVIVPPTPQRSGYAFAKIGPRDAMDFTLIAAAAGVTVTADGVLETVRIGLNGVAPTVIQPRSIEKLLTGKTKAEIRWPDVIGALHDETDAQGDLVYSGEHKCHLAGVTMRRTVESALARAQLDSESAHQ